MLPAFRYTLVRAFLLISPALIMPCLIMLCFSSTRVCLAGNEETPATPAVKPTLVAPKVPKGKLVSEKEAEKFGQQLEKVVATGALANLKELINMRAIGENVVRGLDVPEDFKKGLLSYFDQTFSVQLFSKVQQNTQDGGSYKFLHVREKQGQRTVLFRIIQPDMGGVNYHELSLVNTNGKIRADRIYVFTTGENLSTSMRQTILLDIAKRNKSILAGLTKPGNFNLKKSEICKSIIRALQQRNGEEVLRLYHTLPKEVQENKVYLIFRVQAAVMIEGGEKQYIAAISEFRRLYPNDSCVDLISIDYYALRNETDKLFASLERVNKSVGGDPYLGLLKATFLIEMDRLDEAEKVLKESLEQESSLIELHWSLITIYLEKKEYSHLLNALIKLDQSKVIDWEDMTTVEEYVEFAESPQHQKWLEYLEQKK